jgi:hypothetical protein
MANPESVAQFTLDSFSNGRIAVIRATPLNTGGNAVIALPLLSGGLTNGGAVANSGGVIIRRVTIQNPSGNVAAANISISATNDNANVIVSNVVLSTLSTTGKYQDLTPAAPYTNTAVSGVVAQSLYVNINTPSGNANTVDICVYGDIVSF